MKTGLVRNHLQLSDRPREVRKPEEVILQVKGELEHDQPLQHGFVHILEKTHMQAVNKKVQNGPNASEKHRRIPEVPVDPEREDVPFQWHDRKLLQELQKSEDQKMPMQAENRDEEKRLQTRTSRDVNYEPEM